jgi:hypothetical protein
MMIAAAKYTRGILFSIVDCRGCRFVVPHYTIKENELLFLFAGLTQKQSRNRKIAERTRAGE